MIEDTAVLKTAYEEMVREGKEVTASSLHGRADSLWYRLRDTLIYRQADSTYEKRGVSLGGLAEKVYDLMWEVDRDCAKDLWSGEYGANDADLAYSVACSLAVLRWHCRMRAGRAQECFGMTVAEVEAWLAEHDFPVAKGGQLSLFLDGGG